MGFRKFVLNISVMVAAVFFLSGCSPILIGAAAGATGTHIWTKGNLELMTQFSAGDLYFATRNALDGLDYLVERDRHDRFGASISGRTSTGRKILIKIYGKTEETSKLRVRVGIIGDRNESQMIINAILREAS